MAEEERIWRQKHVHETNTISYGSSGTATYNDNTQQWSFLRRDGQSRPTEDNDEADDRDAARPLLSTLGQPKLLAEPSQGTDSASCKPASVSVISGRYPELAAASRIISTFLRDNGQTSGGIRTRTSCVDFGRVVQLGVNGNDSGNLSLPAYAYVTGQCSDTLRISCVGRETVDHASKNGIAVSLHIPSLGGGESTTWFGITAIQQVAFSQRDGDGHGGTWLAVRQADKTSIFEPLLGRDSSLSLDRSSLDPHLVVAFDESVTGGQDHADVAFHPHDQRRLAIIDVEGNWSIWHIKGRRSNTARVLYQARLKGQGKIFSWEHKKRPNGVELYFDGWHKIRWVSSNGTDVDRLLVCNRQNAKLVDLYGEELRGVDVRLDTRKENAHILDVQATRSSNLCFLLTTERLLLFDFAQVEWKDAKTSTQGPALLCGWQHVYNRADMSLKITKLELGLEDILVGVYSNSSRYIKLYHVKLSQNEGKGQLVVSSSDPTPFRLPDQMLAKAISSISLVDLEVNGREQDLPLLIQVIVQYEDASVMTILAEVHGVFSASRSGQRVMLELPSSRNTKSKSELFVDDMDDELDLAGFIVADEESEQDDDEAVPGLTDEQVARITQSKDVNRILWRITATAASERSLSKVLGELSLETSDHQQRPRRDIGEALEAFNNLLQNDTIIQKMPQACLIAELFDKDVRIEDIETDCAMLERALPVISSVKEDRLRIATRHTAWSGPLLTTYEALFDRYVSSLSPEVEDRVRATRERQIRGIALDLYLSSHVVHRVPTAESASLQQHPATQIHSDPMIFSDPPMQLDSQPSKKALAKLSASQPTSRLSPPSSDTPRIPSPLTAALSRLSAYTSISNPPPQAILSNPETSKHISSLLSHLPISADADPNTYDWQATELNLSAQDPGKKPPQSAKARKAERLARARERAGERLEGPRGTLNGAGIPGARRIETQSTAQPQPQPQIRLGPTLMSEGNAPPDSSSQLFGAMTLTQPERGAFANRPAGNPAGRKKKKKRIAGF